MVVRIFWGITAAIAALSLLTFAGDLGRADSAPQQAAAAAMTLAWVVIPYVLTRALEGLFPPKEKALSAAIAQKASALDIGAAE